MSEWTMIAAAVCIGILLPIQAGVNQQLGQSLGQPAWGALMSFIVGTVALVMVCVTLRMPAPRWTEASAAPVWIWTGGLIGAVFVTGVILLAPRLGASALVSCIVAGQLVSGLLIDHFGLFGYERRPIQATRFTAALLIAAGVWLMRYR